QHDAVRERDRRRSRPGDAEGPHRLPRQRPHDNPLRVAEEVAMIDILSGGRVVCGFVRGLGQESLATNVNPAYNRERFDEAHDVIVKAWTTPGPFRWAGRHYEYRVVNPWMRALQKPHPPI